MITRIWHGWTVPDNAARYEELLVQEIAPGITDRGIAEWPDPPCCGGTPLARRWSS